MKFLEQSLSLFLSCCLVLVTAPGGFAQPDESAAQTPVQAAKQTPEQLQQLVAPIALYPDALVAQILAAATYPDQVVEADRWMEKHKHLEGEKLGKEVDKQPWDPSVKALTEFPSVLANMDKNLAWTSSLGDAYVNQQKDVMNAVLRVSEVLALKWNDLDFIDHLIQVRRAYVDRRFGPPKSKASKAPVPMHPLLAAHLLAWRKETLYPGDEDFVFPSLRLKGKKPPAANMLVADYLRVAARKAGVVAPPRTFGFHTFRRTLASVLVKMKVDVKTVQEILRHQNLKTTLEIYA
ncbi:MAG: DUF3300 domain-containing protein, partial [Terracidiphilus sp.]